MVIVIRECSCCGREFATGVFGFRCDFCQDGFAWTTHGRIGKAHPPCRLTKRAPDSPKADEISKPESVKVESALPAVSG